MEHVLAFMAVSAIAYLASLAIDYLVTPSASAH